MNNNNNELNLQFAQNAINFLNQPACRPSMVGEENRRIAEAYSNVLKTLEQIVQGKISLVPTEIAPETPPKVNGTVDPEEVTVI